MTDLVEARLARDLRRVAEHTPIPPVPTDALSETPVGRSRGRRTVLAAALAVGVGVGVPVAAAAGGLSAITVAFGWTHQPKPPSAPPSPGPAPTASTVPALPVIAANDATGRFVVTVPGPPGHSMQVWVADAVGGGQCVALLEPVAGGYHSLGSECTAATATPGDLEFGAGGGDSTGWITDMYAPKTAAYLTIADGISTRRIPAADGLSAAWLPPADIGRTLTLSAYTASGQLIASTTAAGVYVVPPCPPPPKHIPGCQTSGTGAPPATF